MSSAAKRLSLIAACFVAFRFPPAAANVVTIAFDSLGNRYVGGYFEGQAQFPQANVTSAGGIDSYVVKLPPAVTTVYSARLSAHDAAFSGLSSQSPDWRETTIAAML